MKHKGYALLIVLIAVAILLILYAVQMKPLFKPETTTNRPIGVEQHPWMLAELLVPEGKDVKLPRSPKPQLNEPRTINAAVSRNAEPRGKAAINFGTDGRIKATWNCEYAYDGQTHSITAQMAGNVNVKQTFEDQNGPDKSRLFFIAKGNYVKATASQTAEKGTCWMLGWLKPDGAVEGHITITTDQQWAAAYAFTGPIESEKSPRKNPE